MTVGEGVGIRQLTMHLAKNPPDKFVSTFICSIVGWDFGLLEFGQGTRDMGLGKWNPALIAASWPIILKCLS